MNLRAATAQASSAQISYATLGTTQDAGWEEHRAGGPATRKLHRDLWRRPGLGLGWALPLPARVL